MTTTHQSLWATPVGFHQLSLFRLVAKHRNFTRAAAEAGLTQSAVTRSIGTLEKLIGTPLFERTTRKVALTPAGEFLEVESKRLLGDLDYSIEALREKYADQRTKLRIAISDSVSHAHLYGLLNNSKHSEVNVRYILMSQKDHEIVSSVTTRDCDVGIMCLPRRVPSNVKVIHQFEDRFTMIAPHAIADELEKLNNKKQLIQKISSLPWILFPDGTETGDLIRRWMKDNGIRMDPSMEMMDFDRITHLVMMGIGVSIVPIRTLAPYSHKRKLKRIQFDSGLSRRISVITRLHGEKSPSISDFIKGVLFGN